VGESEQNRIDRLRELEGLKSQLGIDQMILDDARDRGIHVTLAEIQSKLDPDLTELTRRMEPE